MLDNSPNLYRAVARGVLGEYNHSFTIDEHDKYAIIYGPNGIGKTKFLEIVDALVRLDGPSLSHLPFESVVLEYSDGTILGAAQNESLLHRAPIDSVSFRLIRPGENEILWQHKNDDFTSFISSHTSYVPVSHNSWEDSVTGEIVYIDELWFEYERFLARRERWSRFRQEGTHPLDESKVPAKAKEFVALVPSFLIETQRLIINIQTDSEPVRPSRPDRKTTRPQISEQARNMRVRLNQAQTEHSHITQRLDRTFPTRVLGSTSDVTPKEEKVRELYAFQNEFRSRLGRIASVSLDNELSLPQRRLNSTELRLLDLYFMDAEEKLSPFRPLLKKIELLEEIINERLLNKFIQVTDKDGLLVQHTRTGEGIPLESLSSGEQHIIILMIDLLFNVRPGAMVLIDEPEISLHVAWQLSFLSDVERISELVGFKFVVATHSPQIINDKWDFATDLGKEAEQAV